MTANTNSYEAVRIDENTYRIENIGVRSYLFIGNSKALLIDTGFGNCGSIIAEINKITDKPVMLVNSHADPDHLGSNREFDMAFMHSDEIAHYKKHMGEDAPVSPLTEGDIIDIGGRQFEVIHIPGHTPGSIALLDRKNRIIMTGDTVSKGTVYMFGEMRNLPTYMESLKKLISMSDSFDTVYPSHGTFPLTHYQISANLEAAEKLAAGELEAQEPPMPVPAKLYSYKDASFFY
ncbi:MAG: MBL fold metallo-hydrolase [Oscillospiraceae bacterium]|nr:MBL fold metallo-hydrolase [Oscillospiraceae bacterium]